MTCVEYYVMQHDFTHAFRMPCYYKTTIENEELQSDWLIYEKTRLLTLHNQENTRLSLDTLPHKRVGGVWG